MKKPNLKSLKATLLLLTQTAPMDQFVDEIDRKVIRRRSESEGAVFHCNLLPSLGKAFDKALQDGTFVTPPGFATRRGTCLPLLYGKAFSAVFEPCGTLKPDSSIDKNAVIAIRQLTLVAGKCDFGGVTPALEQACWDSFKKNQERLAGFDLEGNLDVKIVKNTTLRTILKRAKKLVHEFASSFNVDDLVPRHGAGACPDKLAPHQRYDVANMVYNQEIDSLMPYSDFMFFSAGHLAQDLEKLQSMPTQDIFLDKAAFVPKDHGRARGISLVPHTLMFFQQALSGWFKERMSSHKYRGAIDISSQTRNQELAREGSLYGCYATLDLADASDSLLAVIVAYLFPEALARCLFATRSKGTMYRGEYCEYKCFAPMGAATCFPVQTVVFWALARAASAVALGREGRVSVYGDDIICQTTAAQAVIDVLTNVGLKVNVNKSFTSGPFRESCGGDYFKGELVTPVRQRKLFFGNGDGIVGDGFEYTDFVNRVNSVYKVSMFEDVFAKFHRIGEQWSKREIPIISVDTVLALQKDERGSVAPLALIASELIPRQLSPRSRWNNRLHRREIQLLHRGPCPVPIINDVDYLHILDDMQLESHFDLRGVAIKYIPQQWRKAVAPLGSVMIPRALERTRSGWCDALRQYCLTGNEEALPNTYAPRGRVKYTARWIPVTP